MLWFALCVLAIACLQWGKRLHLLDEIYGLALYSAGSLAALWGLAIAPSEAQIGFGILALGGLQLKAIRIHR